MCAGRGRWARRPYAAPRLAPGAFRVPHVCLPRERGRLTRTLTPRRLEVLFQLLVFAPQPLPLGLRPAEVLAQLLVVSTESLDLARVRRRLGLAERHAPVMPNSCTPYKKKQPVSLADPLT